MRHHILLIGTKRPNSIESGYLNGFKRLGYSDTDIIDLRNYGLRSYITERTSIGGRLTNRLLDELSIFFLKKGLLTHLRKYINRYDLIIVFKGSDFSKCTLEMGRHTQVNAIWLNINPDDPFAETNRLRRRSLMDSFTFYDLYCTWSKILFKKLHDSGCRDVMYLPFAYDSTVHRPSCNCESSEGDVSFVGAWDQEREIILQELGRYDIRVFGGGWNRIRKNSPLSNKITPRYIYGEEFSRVIGHSKCSLNLLRNQNIGAHNMRTFEIPAVKGLMVTKRSEEQQEFFPDGEASLMFNDINELHNIIDYLLSHQVDADLIRQRGYELVQHHSYIDRTNHLLQKIGIM